MNPNHLEVLLGKLLTGRGGSKTPPRAHTHTQVDVCSPPSPPHFVEETHLLATPWSTDLVGPAHQPGMSFGGWVGVRKK